MLAYATFVVPRLAQRDKIRKHARQIDLIVPSNVPLYAVDPQYQPYLFYVRAPVIYASDIDELPRETKFFLVRAAAEGEATATRHWWPRHPQLVLRMKDYRDQEVVLFAVTDR